LKYVCPVYPVYSVSSVCSVHPIVKKGIGYRGSGIGFNDLGFRIPESGFRMPDSGRAAAWTLDPIPETLYPVLYDFSVFRGDKNVAFVFINLIQHLSEILSLLFDGFFRSGTTGGIQARSWSRISIYHFLLSDNEL